MRVTHDQIINVVLHLSWYTYIILSLLLHDAKLMNSHFKPHFLFRKNYQKN